MSKLQIANFFKNFGAEFSKHFRDAFEKPMTKMVSEMQKNYKNLFQSFKVARQNLNGEKAGARELVDIFANIKSGNEEELNKSPHEREKAELLKYYEKQQKKQKEYDYIDENVKDSELAKKLKGMIDMKYESQTVAEKTKGDLGELEKMFSSTMQNILKGTKDFDESMKSLVNDLQNYFIKTFTDAIAKGFINSTVGNLVSDTMSGLTGFISANTSTGVNGVFDVVKHLFGFHHSGGYIPRGTGDGFSLPGTAEYLSVLKGGERVLSPAEAIGYNSPSEARKNIIVNNFNVKAWDSKDVGQYLLDNKHLLANITYENIRNNNCSLRNIIGGI